MNEIEQKTNNSKRPDSKSDNFIKEINIDEVIHSVKFEEDDEKNTQKDTDKNYVNGESTFFTEGVLDNPIEVDEPLCKVNDNDEGGSNFTKNFKEPREQAYLQNHLNIDHIKPVVNFNLNKSDHKKKLFRSTSNREILKPYSSKNRSATETPDKNKSLIYPFFGNQIQFLPSIQCEKDKFPSRRNLHHKRIYVRYITNKIEKEHEFISMIRSNTIPLNNPLKSSSGQMKSKINIEKDKTYLTSQDSEVYYDTKAIFAGPPPPPPSAKNRFFKLQKNLTKNLNSTFNRSKSNISMKKPLSEIEDETNKSIPFDYKPIQSHVNSVNNIVDINVISNSSKLSGHFMYEGKQRLQDLNLNEVWPASSMYKVTIKENPWVSSFKAKSHAHEISSTFRDNFDSNLSFTRLHTSGTKKSQNITQNNFFPNIKNLL